MFEDFRFVCGGQSSKKLSSWPPPETFELATTWPPPDG
jgi:hypothetical protein